MKNVRGDVSELRQTTASKVIICLPFCFCVIQSGKKARYEQATEKYKLFQKKKDRINQMDGILTVSFRVYIFCVADLLTSFPLNFYLNRLFFVRI